MSVGIERPQSVLGTGGSNARGIVAMLAAMAFFCTGDTLIKLAGGTLPVGQLMFMRGLVGSVLILVIARSMGALTHWPSMLSRPVLWRTFCDAGATICFITGLVVMPFANAAAIGQFTPLAVTALAALLLAEPVGWRRWLATSVGLIGVMIIVKPGTDAFDWGALWIIASVGFVAFRDILTRKMGAGFHPVLLTTVSALGVMLTGAAQAPLERWIWPGGDAALIVASAAASALAGQYAIIHAMRAGEVSVVGPFRYSVIVFAVFSGVVVFGERPALSTYLGILIVVLAGIYTFHREALRRREADAARRAGPGAGRGA